MEICAARFEVDKLVGMLVAADHDGNWKLYVAVVEELISVFSEFDSINYLRHTSWYLEWIKALKSEKLCKDTLWVKIRKIQ